MSRPKLYRYLTRNRSSFKNSDFELKTFNFFLIHSIGFSNCTFLFFKFFFLNYRDYTILM